MSKFLRASVIALALSFVGSVAPASAASIIFSGVDIGGGVGGPRVNSDAAHAAWLAAAGGFNFFENFEGIAVGSSTPVSLAGGMMTLTTVGGPIGSTLNQVANDQDPQIGYNTTAGGANFFRLSPEFGGAATMTISFSSPVRAFGVYVTGIQTNFGLTTALWGADSFQLPDTQGVPGQAGVQFFGFTSDTLISSISFRTVANPAVGRDIMGFDDIQIVAVPEPVTIALVLGGLAAGVARRRRD